MKKPFLSMLFFVALATAGSGFSAALAQDRIAQAVPADTLFYFAGTRDSAFAKLLAPLRESALASILDAFATGVGDGDDDGQALRFLEGLTRAYANQAGQDGSMPGVPDAAQISVYTVGIVPVVRVQLSDADAFRQFLDTAEKLGGAQATQGTFKDVTFREYRVGATDEQVPAQLLVAVRPGFAVFTLDAEMFRDKVLPLALGLQSPGQSLPQNNALQDIVAANDFNYQNLGFINHQAIVAALTGAQDSVAGHMLDMLGADKELGLLRNPACAADIRGIFANWPVTALGVTKRSVTDGKGWLSGRIVSRVTDSSLMDLLASLRGHVPAALLDGKYRPMFSLALALNMDNLATTAMQLQQRFLQADFQCPPLQTAQQQLQQDDPSAYLIPFSAMVKGVHGVSLSVFDADPSAAGVTRGLDAMVVISAEYPRMVFKMAKMFAPDTARSAHLPGDGSPVELMPAQDGRPAVKAMIAGKHLLLFSGPQAFDVARSLDNDELETNGIAFARFDYGKLMDLARQALPAAGALMTPDGKALAEDVQRQMQTLDSVEIRVNSLVDFGPQGVVVNLDGDVAVNDRAKAAAGAAE